MNTIILLLNSIETTPIHREYYYLVWQENEYSTYSECLKFKRMMVKKVIVTMVSIKPAEYKTSIKCECNVTKGNVLYMKKKSNT